MTTIFDLIESSRRREQGPIGNREHQARFTEPLFREIAAVAVEALNRVGGRVFAYSQLCDACDNGFESCPCTCMDYTIADLKETGQWAREALSKIQSLIDEAEDLPKKET